jgi:hypothetical protein
VAFVSNASFQSGGGLAAADLICNNEAAGANDGSAPWLVQRAGRFTALLAAGANPVDARFALDAGPVYRIDGQLVFAGNEPSTYQKGLSPVLFTAKGNPITSNTTAVWTGIPNFNCNSWTSSGVSAAVAGDPRGVGRLLLDENVGTLNFTSCSTNNRLYCVEQ